MKGGLFSGSKSSVGGKLPPQSVTGNAHDAVRVGDSSSFRKRTPFAAPAGGNTGGAMTSKVTQSKVGPPKHLNSTNDCAYGVARTRS